MLKYTFILLANILLGYGCTSKKNAPEAISSSIQKASTYSPVDKTTFIDSSKMVGLPYLMGKFNPAEDDRFIVIDIAYADRAGMYIRKETYADFIKMYEAARKEGIKMQIRSATRNFDYQKGIWERKWNGKTLISDGTNVATDIPEDIDKALKILQYSSMPGTSRHHWGTDIDLNSFNNEWFEKGEGLILYNWMVDHAHEYGFCQPYTVKGDARPDGYNEEKWHWTYTPLSEAFLAEARQLEDNMISGFLGSEQASHIGVVEKYIFGINHTCK